MSDQTQTVVELEPMLHTRSGARGRSETQLKKADLNDIMGSETLVLATAVAQAILAGMEHKDRRRERRILVCIACGLAFLVGMIRLAIQLV